jgi:sRNA-binding regulator protein Hfq
MSLITETITAHVAQKDKVSVFLRNGVQLIGVIKTVDVDAFVLVSNAHESSLLLIDAVATIKKWVEKPLKTQ